jgi:site-specific recombinase XerD
MSLSAPVIGATTSSVTPAPQWVSQVRKSSDNSSLIGEWADWLDAVGKAPRTTELYVGIVHRFLSRRYTRGHSLLEITSSEIVAYLAELGAHGPTRKQSRVALRSLFGYLHRRGFRDDDPAAILEGAKERIHRTPPAPFTRSEFTRLVSAAFRRDPRRGWALLACYGLGTRRTEFVRLRPQDIDWDCRRVHLAFTKGDKPRDVDMGPTAEKALSHLLSLEAKSRGRVEGTILGISPATFTSWVNQAARDCGFPPGRKRRAHTLRSTFATRLAHAGVPTVVIRDLLGHESIETTNDYVASDDGDGARAVSVL